MSLEQLPYLPPAEQEQFLDGPALALPEGAELNLDDYPRYNNGPHVLFAFSIFIVLAVLCIRSYSRWYSLRKFDLSDCMSSAASLDLITLKNIQFSW